VKQFKAKISANKKIAPGHYTLSFKTPIFKEAVRPGQFFNIKVNDSLEPLLRRPFGAYKIHRQKVEILYKVVGEATKILSAKKKGGTLDILGPLGNGFDIKSPMPADQAGAILVAGGHGVAPLYALASAIAKTRNARNNLTVFIGAKTKKHVVCDKDFRKLGAKVYIATDDGSKGYRGLVTNLLSRLLRAKEATIYACGPKAMLKETAKVAKQHGIPCRLSLEEYMACGIGTCLGCAVKTRSGYKMVCKDGPVFDAGEIIWQH